MKETLELRLNYDYAHLLFDPDEGKTLGTSVRIVEISKEDPRYSQIPIISRQVEEKYDKGFFYGWQIKRKYTKAELEAALLLHVRIKYVFEPAGEECGTVYDETVACEICRANRKQVGALRLKKGTIPNKDIARTIAGEVVVSEKFAEIFKRYGLRGALFDPVIFDKGTSNYYQLIASSPALELTKNTIVGGDVFDLGIDGNDASDFSISGHMVRFEKEVYKCPQGHLIGLNLLSEPYILDTKTISDFDFFSTKQKIGVKRGLLRPEPLYLCSPAFRKMVVEEKLTGFEFEIAHIE